MKFTVGYIFFAIYQFGWFILHTKMTINLTIYSHCHNDVFPNKVEPPLNLICNAKLNDATPMKLRINPKTVWRFMIIFNCLLLFRVRTREYPSRPEAIERGGFTTQTVQHDVDLFLSAILTTCLAFNGADHFLWTRGSENPNSIQALCPSQSCIEWRFPGIRYEEVCFLARLKTRARWRDVESAGCL